MTKILVFDNYDSFTYNLVHLVEKILHVKVSVFRNDEIDLEKIKEFDKIILSPGPGLPAEAGLLMPLIKEYAASKSILGVCLGHQAIGSSFGAELVNLDTVYHGVATPIQIIKKDSPLFKGLQAPVMVGRYHSWIVSKDKFPEVLDITAVDDNNFIMALQHKNLDVQGVQFHPESVLTPDGELIIRNWLKA
ncbi:MAG: aminodeoxychorismate/anthranilate synthase component II [Bacteroidetes bacterium]|nr:aminodeoxychorismate/anthranilate synthase component II [Bacteroidota bacterium]MBS1757751.1 aminodeoxychorismate/anthranilate synthase component II [Bacteroidota bacterium]